MRHRKGNLSEPLAHYKVRRASTSGSPGDIGSPQSQDSLESTQIHPLDHPLISELSPLVAQRQDTEESKSGKLSQISQGLPAVNTPRPPGIPPGVPPRLDKAKAILTQTSSGGNVTITS